MTSITVNGQTYDSADFEGYGYVETITAGTGESLPRFQALFADLLADASRARQTTSATSKNAALTGSQSWVLAEDISFAVGAYVTIARTSAPTTTYYVAQVTGYVSGTKTLTVTVIASAGSGGPYTDWTVAVSGKPLTLTDGDYGDITVGSSGTTMTIDAGAVGTDELAADSVTYAKMQNVSAQYKILARKSASAGDVEECSLDDILAFATRFKVVSTTRDISTASGNQDITGFNFDPKGAVVLAVVNATNKMSIGVSDGSSSGCVEDIAPVSADTYGPRASAVSMTHSSGNTATATLSLITDGVRLAWTKTGSPTGTATLYILGYR